MIFHQVQGLCGNFNFNTEDDFGVEESAISFGNTWSEGNCKDVANKMKLKPCEIYLQNKKYAEEQCGKLEQPPFSSCHGYVDPKPFVENCKQDVCGCSGKSDCLCSVLAAYAKQCSMQGVALNWRVNNTCRKYYTYTCFKNLVKHI